VATTAYRTVTEFTATAGQTSFSVPSYTAGYINVYRNGALLGTSDYTATSGTTVVLANPASSGDLVVTESFFVSSVLNAIPATNGAVTSAYLLDGGVTTAKIADANVTQAKLASNIAGNGPAFSAYQSSAQSVSAGTWTKITCTTEDFDTNSNYSTVDSRFTPTVAGYYQVTGRIRPNSTNGEAEIGIYKNGSAWFHGSNVNVSSGNQWGVLGTGLLYMNGSTDYVEMYLYITNAGTVSTSRQNTYFQAALVRTA
jgi:hypothetical protein